jgi:ATP-dependent DNA helicase DinG
LPFFASPDDPIARPRSTWRPAASCSVTTSAEVALALKQGVGRLIRSEEDEGVVVICDPRLSSRGYGRSMLARAADAGHAQS